MALLCRRTFLVLLLLVTPTLFAHDVTLTGTQSFASLDGSASDHDGAANGVYTVNDGNLVVNGVVNCNDDGVGDGACAMAFAVSGNMTVNTGGALYAENRSGGGTGGAITLTVGGNLTLSGNAIVSTASKTSSGANGGAITANVSGGITVGTGSTVDSGSSNARGGNISLAAAGLVSVDGNVLSGPSRTILSTRLTGAALDGGTANQIGGSITIASNTFVEPAIVIGGNANIISQGDSNGAGPVKIDGCGIQVRGLVAALSRKDSAAKVSLRSGKDLLVDGRDLGTAGAPLGRNGRVRADSPSGTAINKGVDLFASETIDVFGPSNTHYVITSLPGLHDSKSYGGLIRIISTGDAVNGSGNMIDDGHTASGDTGGTVEISAKEDITLNTAVIRAVGDFNTNNPDRGGGSIDIRSYSGDVIWTNGTGEVRPVGSSSNLALADQGSIVLTACGIVNTAGSSFPVMGTATSVFPETHTGVCSPAAPSLPTGVPPLITCNTPPVANDTSASTNEDTTVTITMTGTDADGDPLTFTIVSGPSNGSLGAVISTGPNSATVDYTPNLNYNGADSFVFRAHDGNGGTDDGVASITIAPVNDPPVFLVGADVSVLEDSGPQTITNWATGISGGPADESGQTVTFTVTNSNPSLFSVQPALSSTGTLTFTPAAHANGSATLTVTAQDNGGIANGGDDTSNPQTSNITVTAVNDEPSFVKGADQTVNEDAGAQSVSNWATAINAGPNEGSQTVSFVTTNSNNALFSAQPSVDSSGTLTYTPAADANGSATVTISAQDDGGVDDGGDDTSSSQTFTITVNAVNDAPSFTSGGDVTVLEDSAAYSAAWATAISAGPADESTQTVSFSTSNDNNALFSTQPSISATGDLTFTPALNQYGSATVTVTLSDNGGTANGGDDTSNAQTFTITLAPVNDEPSFTSGGNVAVNEDSGAYSAAWATAISAGPNETQGLTFVATNDNNGLFSAQPSVSASGVLTFTTAANANGSATVTIYLQDDGGVDNGGDDTSSTVTFTITVNSVNDEPSFTGGGDVSVGEDSGAYSAAWATAISAGPANESTQTVTFFTTNGNNSLFSVQPSVSSTGVLSFTVAANATGNATVTIYAQDDGGTANGGDDTSASQTFTISVTGINDPPTFTPGADQTSNEDAGPQTVPAWATGISSGPGESDTITFVTTNDNNALFSAQPSVAADGTLTYTAAPNANGTATVTIYAQDNGGTANGGDDTSATYTFTITIVAVNDAPSFTKGTDVTVDEDTGSVISPNWASPRSAGPPDESGQTLTFTVTNDNNALFSVQPAIASNGTLTFTTAANAYGTATVTVTLSDDGGTANGGVDTSAPQTFTITINAVNDAPSFTGGGDVTVNEDSGPYAASWASAISAGPNETQTLTFNVSNNNNSLFLVQPSINSSGLLTFTPALNAFGSATVTVTLSDNGGTANGGVDTSAPQTFVINVTALNDAPTAGNDSWQTLGNTELRVDLVAGLTPHVADTTPSGNGVRDNDNDPEGDPHVVTGIVGCGDITAPFDCTLPGGAQVSMLPNGSFSYTPAPGATSGSFQYTVTDIPVNGSPATATGTVNISIIDMIWYVNGAAAPGGNGTSNAPFINFASLNGVGDVDGPGETIFVHTSAVAGSIGLEAGQKLWGQGIGLSKPYNLNGNGSPTVLVAPGVKPTVTSVSDTVSIAGVSGTEVAGLALVSTAGNAIDVTANPLGSAAGVSIYSNVLSAGTEGIDVNGGSAGGSVVLMDNNTITSTGNGIDVNSAGVTTVSVTNAAITSTAGSGIRMDATGTLTVTGLQNITVSGNTAVDGIRINNAAFSAVSTGTIAVGASGNPVGAEGVVLSNGTGSVAFGTLTVFGSTSGVTISGAGAGFTVTGAGGSISTVSGLGLGVSNASIGAANLTFTSISAAGGTNGINLVNTGTAGGLKVLGTGAAGSGGTISNTAVGVNVNNSHKLSLSSMNLTSANTLDGGGAGACDAATVTGCNGAVKLVNASDIALSGLAVTGTIAENGVFGSGVTNLDISNTSITNAGNAVNEHGIRVVNLLGTSAAGKDSVFSNVNVTNSAGHNILVVTSTATNAFPGAPDQLTITGSTSHNPGSATPSDGMTVAVRNTANFRTVATGNTFSTVRIAIDALQVDAGNTSHSDVSITGNTFTDHNTAVNVSGAVTSNTTFNISSNPTVSVTAGTAINIASNGDSNLRGTVNNNVVTVPAAWQDGAGSENNGFGIDMVVDQTGSIIATVNGNNVNGPAQGFRGTARNGVGASLNLTLTNNTFAAKGLFASWAVMLAAGNGSAGEAASLCVNLNNNQATTTGAFFEEYWLEQWTGNTFNLQGLTPASGATEAQVEAFVSSKDIGGATVEAFGGTVVNYTGGTICTTP